MQLAFGVFALAAAVLAAPTPADELDKRALLGGTTPTTTSSTAAPAATPQMVYSGMIAIPTTPDLLSNNKISTYSVSSCQALCAANPKCVFFNIYQASAWLSATTNNCNLYSQQHAWYDSQDLGLLSFASYSNAAGYVMPSIALTVPTGTTTPAGATTAAAVTTASSVAAVVTSAATSAAAVVTSAATSAAAPVVSTASSAVAAVVQPSSSKAASAPVIAAISTPVAAVSSVAAGVGAAASTVASSAAAAVVPSSSKASSLVLPTAGASSTVAGAVSTVSSILFGGAASSAGAALTSAGVAAGAVTSAAATPTTSALGGIQIGTVISATTGTSAAGVGGIGGVASAATSSAAAIVPAATSSAPVVVAAATSSAAAVITPTTTSSSSAAAQTTGSSCNLPGFAYPGWCKTTANMIAQINAAAANPASLQSGIIIPLYIYPSWWTTPGAWDWVVNAAQQYPGMTFTVIVNPSSGPGTTATPNSDYVHEISRLNALSNIVLLGYVDTAYGSRTLTNVLNDVSVYAGWGNANSAIALDGIFFDNAASTATYIAQYTSYAQAVRANSGFTGGRIVGLAPGSICNPSYVDLADFVVIYEQDSATVQGDLFGWYQSFYTGLTTAQLSKISWLVNAADATTQLAVANLQAAFNTKYLYVTDMSGWQTFVTQPSAGTLAKVLAMLANPLNGVDLTSQVKQNP
ncbi:hypothetical protein PYCC9005_002693 [Savitreella phatthalungensis]